MIGDTSGSPGRRCLTSVGFERDKVDHPAHFIDLDSEVHPLVGFKSANLGGFCGTSTFAADLQCHIDYVCWPAMWKQDKN